MQINKIKFDVKGDDRGNLIALEQHKDIPFGIKRVYYIYDVKSAEVRGKHAHKTLEQVLICVNGSCEILLDDGHEREIVLLDRKDEGLYVRQGMWREMFHFSEGAILITIASELYDENDYIHNYNEFIGWVKSKENVLW